MKKKDESRFSLANIQRQYVECRRHKRNTANALRFQAVWDLRRRLWGSRGAPCAGELPGGYLATGAHASSSLMPLHKRSVWLY